MAEYDALEEELKKALQSMEATSAEFPAPAAPERPTIPELPSAGEIGSAFGKAWEAAGKQEEAPKSPYDDFEKELRMTLRGMEPEKPLAEVATAALERGWHDLKTSPEGFYAEWLSATGKQHQADEIRRELEERRKAANLTEQAESWQGVKDDPSRIVRYGVERFAENFPQMVAAIPFIFSGTGAAAVGARVAAPALARWTAPTLAKYTAKYAPAVGGTVGGIAPSIVMETSGAGEEYFRDTGTTQGGAALAAGTFAGVVEGFGGVTGLTKGIAKDVIKGIGRETAEEAEARIAKELAKKAEARTVRGAVTETGKTTLQEAGTETIQEAGVLAGKTYATRDQPQPYQFFSAETLARLEEAGATGGIVGGPIGAGGAAYQAMRKVTPLEEIPGFEKSYKTPLHDLRLATETIPELQLGVPKTKDKVLDDILHPLNISQQDPSGMSEQMKLLADERGPGSAAFSEVLEASTDRYMVLDEQGRAFPQLYTDTDLEMFLATFPQAQNFQIRKVEHSSLDHRGIMADVFDLPEASSGKVWFLPETPAADRPGLLQQYDDVQRTVENERKGGALFDSAAHEQRSRAEMEAKLKPLLDAGLRAIPSYGRTFRYSGKMTGIATTPTLQMATGRTRQIGIFDPATGTVKLKQGVLAPSDQPAVAKGIPVSLDLRRLKPGEVSGYPQRMTVGTPWSDLPGWQFKKGMTAQQKADAFAWLESQRPGMGAPGVDVIQELMNRGVWYAPEKSGVLVPKKGLDLKHYTYGIRRDRARSQGPLQTEASANLRERWGELRQDQTTVDRLAGEKFSPSDEMMARRMEKELSQYTKPIDRLMKRLGMPGGVKIVVSNIYPYPAAAAAEQGTIYLSPGYRKLAEMNRSSTGSFEQDINQLLLHELGHIVTYTLFTRLSVEEQQMLRAAYNRALLSDRVQVEALRGSRISPEFNVQELFNQQFISNYYLSFSEWLAEQFRRHARTDVTMREEFEKPIAGMTAALEKYFREYEALMGAEATFDLRSPDTYFSAVMRHLEDRAKAVAPLRAHEQSTQLYRLADGFGWSPNLQKVMLSIAQAIAAVGKMDINAVSVVVQDVHDPRVWTQGAAPGPVRYRMVDASEKLPGGFYRSRATSSINNPIALIELAVSTLPSKRARAQREVVAGLSEAWVQTYQELNLLDVEERRILAVAAKQAGIKLDSNTKSVIKSKAIRASKEANLPVFAWKNIAKELEDKLIAAKYAAHWSRTGVAPTLAQTILNKMMALFRAISDFMFNTGYADREQLLREIFDGTIAARYQSQVPKTPTTTVPPPVPSASVAPEAVVQVDAELHAYVTETEGGITYSYYRGPMAASRAEKPLTDYVGYVRLKNRTGLGFEVDNIDVVPPLRRQGYSKRFNEFWTKELNAVHRPSGMLTPDGRTMWLAKDPEQVRYHVHDSKYGDLWLSPRKVEELIGQYQSALDAGVALVEEGEIFPLGPEALAEKLRYYKSLHARIDPKAWGDPKLLVSFSRDTVAMDGVAGAVARDGQQADGLALEDALNGMENSTPDSFTEAHQQALQWSQAENAKTLGVEYDLSAPKSILSWPLRKLRQRQGLDHPPDVDRALTGLSAEADRIGHFAKWWWSLPQLAQQNLHVEGLQRYTRLAQQMAQRVTQWMSRMDDSIKAWESLEQKGQERVGNYMFWLAEMQYRTAAEVAQGVQRHPTQQEIDAEQLRTGFTQADKDMVIRMQVEFETFLSDVERVREKKLRQNITDPQQLAMALTRLQAEMSTLRSKPYFPFVRFGEHTITIRDPSNNNEVVWFSAYESPAERNRELRRLAADPQYQGMDMKYGRIPENMHEFMGLPPALIQYVKEEMRNLGTLTPDQERWLDNFAAQHIPQDSGRRRWLQKEGTAGFSLEAFRAYAYYFQQGSNYLARMEYLDDMRAAMDSVKEDKDYKNSERRILIYEYMGKHFKYINTGTGSFVKKIRTFTAVFHLGWVPASAAAQLTQVPMVAWPYFMRTFGSSELKLLSNLMRKFRRGGTMRGLPPAGHEAYSEMTEQGRISIGQAADLGAYAEGRNLSRLMRGNPLQKIYRQQWLHPLHMFGEMERWNRDIVFRASWELAMKHPNNPKMREIGNYYTTEIQELIAKYGWSHPEAVAFLFAREAIDVTQGNYAPWARPAFLQNNFAAVAGIFLQYIQTILYALHYHAPWGKMLLIWLVIAGVQGLPGAEDINEVLKFTAWKLFGADFDLLRATRQFVRHITKDTVFDELGPDLMMHGVSRYGFGIGFLSELMGAPRFDMSSNVGMGRIVPGLTPTLQALRGKPDSGSAALALAEGVAGASAAPLFALLKASSTSPGSIENRHWMSMFPKAVHNQAKAWKYATEGETTTQGARVVSFDPRDPEDMAQHIHKWMTVAAQMGGFKPTAVAQYWERHRAFADMDEVYQARKLALYADMFEAVRVKDKATRLDVIEAIKRYNADTKAAGVPSHQISPEQVEASVRGRLTTVTKQELDIVHQRSSYSVWERIKELYPEVVQSKRVR